MLIETKWQVTNELSKYFNLTLHRKNIIPPSINIFKTNLSHKEKDIDSFWQSVGLSYHNAEYINNNAILFYSIEKSSKERNYYSDMVIVINELSEVHQKQYITFDYQITDIYGDVYSNLIRFRILDSVNIYYSSIYSKYRNNIKKIIPNKTSLKTILKFRYSLELSFDLYNRVCSEIDWNTKIDKIKNNLKISKSNKKFNFIDTEAYMKIVSKNKDMIFSNKENLSSELNKKLELIQHKYNLKNVMKNFYINILMLLITTLMLIITLIMADNSLSGKLKEFLNSLIDIIKHYS